MRMKPSTVIIGKTPGFWKIDDVDDVKGIERLALLED